MKLEIKEQKENPLLKRTEMKVVIKSMQTPSRKDLIKQVAAETGKDTDVIVIDSVNQEFGKTETIAYVKIYKNKKERDMYDSTYKIERTEGRKESTEEKKEEIKKEKGEKNG